MAVQKARRWQYIRWIWFVVMLVINAPIITLALNSLRTTNQIFSEKSLLPQHPSLVNYQYLSFRTSFWTFFRNSVIVAATATALTIVGASLAGYALSRYRMVVTTGYSRLLLMVQMFPVILALIPLFIIFRILQQ